MNQKQKNAIGLLALVFVSSIIIFLTYGDIIKTANTVFFTTGGDGLKSTYGSIYHYEHDSTYMRTTAQNYPYGELVFFSGNQPLIINSLKVLKTIGVDSSGNLLGILNLWLIFTLLLGVFCIYLVFKELGLPILYSIIVANIVAFTSPQIERFSGHYNLAYLFILPLFVYLLLRYYKKPTYLLVFITSLFAFFALYVHGYFYAFYAIWLIFMFIYIFIAERQRLPFLTKMLPHFLIMIVLPFVLFTLFTNDIVTDRTMYPWGGIQSRAFPRSVFLPVNLPYGVFMGIGGIVSYFIGLTSTIIFFILLYQYIKNFKHRSWYKFTNNSFLNAIFWGAFVALMFSFMYPFKWGIEWLFNYTGLLRQFRGTGRFSWIFYYAINFISFYYLWQWFSSKKSKAAIGLLILALSWGIYDSYLNLHKRGSQFNNKIPEISDFQNNLPQNQWVDSINTIDYQAILPLPFYHIGSEAFWINANGETEKQSYITSLKTGIPLISAMLSRTSISQTLNILELYYKPIESYSILSKFKNKKDILIMTLKKSKLNDNEQRILEQATRVAGNNLFDLYKLPFEKLKQIPKQYTVNIVADIDSVVGNNLNKFIASDSSSNYKYIGFGENIPEKTGTSRVFESKLRKETIISDTMLFNNQNPVKLSFWVANLNEDLIARSKIRIETFKGEQKKHNSTTSIFRKIKYINNEYWGLFEIEYQPKEKNERLVLSVYNKYTTSQTIKIDDLLIRDDYCNVYLKTEQIYFKNNTIVNNH